MLTIQAQTGRCPAADLFGKKGRAWLAEQPLPADEEIAVASALRRLDVAGEELALVDHELAKVGLASAEVKRLLTIPRLRLTRGRIPAEIVYGARKVRAR